MDFGVDWDELVAPPLVDPAGVAQSHAELEPEPEQTQEDGQQASAAVPTQKTAAQDVKQVTLTDVPAGLTKLEQIKWKKANGLRTEKTAPAPALETRGEVTLDDMPGGLTKLGQIKWKKANGLASGAPSGAGPLAGMSKADRLKLRRTDASAEQEAKLVEAGDNNANGAVSGGAAGVVSDGGITLSDMPMGLSKIDQLKWKKKHGLY
jgi:hypothetical protein